MSRRRLIGYVRTFGPQDPRPLSWQRDAIATACAKSNWKLVELIAEAPNSPPGTERPRLQEAVSHLSAGRVDGLIVAAAQSLALRVSSLVDLIALLDQTGTALVILDPMLDTGEGSGRSAVDLLTALVAAERDGERARHASRQADGKGRGRLAVSGDPELRHRITTMRESGTRLQAIADTLNSEGVATVRNGALWRPSSVQAAAGYRRPRPKKPLHPGPPPPPPKPPRPPAPGRTKA